MCRWIAHWRSVGSEQLRSVGMLRPRTCWAVTSPAGSQGTTIRTRRVYGWGVPLLRGRPTRGLSSHALGQRPRSNHLRKPEDVRALFGETEYDARPSIWSCDKLLAIRGGMASFAPL